MALQLNASVLVQAPAERVFAVISAPDRLPEWNVSVERARRVEPEAPVGLGSRCVFSGKLMGQSIESETEVVQYEPPRLFCTRAIRGPKLSTCFSLDEADPGTRVTIEVSGDVPGGMLGQRIAEGFLRRELTASLERLRGLAEQQP